MLLSQGIETILKCPLCNKGLLALLVHLMLLVKVKEFSHICKSERNDNLGNKPPKQKDKHRTLIKGGVMTFERKYMINVNKLLRSSYLP